MKKSTVLKKVEAFLKEIKTSVEEYVQPCPAGRKERAIAAFHRVTLEQQIEQRFQEAETEEREYMAKRKEEHPVFNNWREKKAEIVFLK